MTMVTKYDGERETMTPHATRAAFRATIAEVAARAKERLPEAVNGRIESAVKLVLAHDVLFLEDGTVEVGSASDPLKTYTLAGHACDCQDFAYGQAPDGWCQHRIAAGIAKRVGELLPALPVEPWPDNDPEDGPAPAVETEPMPAPTRERAGMRLETQVMIDGRPVKVAVWGPDDADVQARLQAVLAAHPAPASPPASAQGQPPGDTPQCPTHGAMRQGKRGWFCPNKMPDGETWCKSKGK